MKHRAVVAGCGSMSRGWLKAVSETPGLNERVQIVGLVDLDPKAAIALAAESGIKDIATGSDLAAMLDALKPDLLFDVVTPAARRAVVEIALNHGCHVLSEKPMASSMDEARELLTLARAAGKVHAVTQNRRYNSGVQRMRAAVASGVLGRLTAIHADFFVGAHFGGFRDHMRNVLLLDMAIHTLDAARYVSGKQPIGVYCQEFNPPGSWYDHGSAANAIFELSDEVTFTYRGSWSAEGANTSWDASWRIIGTKGTLLWDGDEGLEAHIVAGDDGFLRPLDPVTIAPPPDPSRVNGHASVITEFIDAIENGRAPETSGEDNILSLAMVFAAIQSAEARQRVAITI